MSLQSPYFFSLFPFCPPHSVLFSDIITERNRLFPSNSLSLLSLVYSLSFRIASEGLGLINTLTATLQSLRPCTRREKKHYPTEAREITDMTGQEDSHGISCYVAHHFGMWSSSRKDAYNTHSVLNEPKWNKTWLPSSGQRTNLLLYSLQ